MFGATAGMSAKKALFRPSNLNQDQESYGDGAGLKHTVPA